MLRWGHTLFMWLYEALWFGLSRGLSLLGLLVKRHKAQLHRRRFGMDDVSHLRSLRLQRAVVVPIFVSSAGEFEQAKPLARLLVEERNALVVFVMGSVSGIRFAKTQGEAQPYFLAPWDAPSEWKKFFQALKPDFSIVIRYELWPGFLSVASYHSPVYLVDAVQSNSLKTSALARWYWRSMLKKVAHVFTVGPHDFAFYKSQFDMQKEDLSLVGDTKYDRVLERFEERAEKREEITELLSLFCEERNIVILGSAWPDDLSALLTVFPSLQRHRPALKLIVAPHDVSDHMAVQMLQMLETSGFKVCRTSQGGIGAARSDDDVLLVDELGLLPELYSLAHVAWVGGAMHHRVHNVLEAACWGLYVCFGPRYHTSQEAVGLVHRGLAKVIANGEEFAAWFDGLSFELTPPHRALWSAVEAEQGASRKILESIFSMQTPR